MNRFVKLIPIFFLCFGCASTKLQLNLDIYKEDPFRSLPISVEQMARIESGIGNLEGEAVKLSENRKNLGDNLFNTYNEIFYVMTKAKDPNFTRYQLTADTIGFRNQLIDYKTTIDNKLDDIKILADSARKTLAAFSRSLMETNKTAETVSELDLLRDIKKFEKSVVELGGPLNTEFEASLYGNWGTVIKMASAENLKALFKKDSRLPSLTELRKTAESYSKDIEELKTSGYRIPEEATHALHDAVKDLQEPTPGAFITSVDAIARATTTLSPAIGLGDGGATELSRLTQATTLLNSQIDRLQDPADPVWRIISDPRNEPKWNKEFSETYFYAQGNSSVVVVRDTPISFRQQRGSNNPATLIKNQLQISRAIGNAAISIAAATTGVPINLKTESDQTGTTSSNTDTAAESEALARRKAMAEERLKLRTLALRNLRNNLISIREEFRLKESSKTLKDYSELKSRLESILKAHQPFFKNASNSQDGQ